MKSGLLAVAAIVFFAIPLATGATFSTSLEFDNNGPAMALGSGSANTNTLEASGENLLPVYSYWFALESGSLDSLTWTASAATPLGENIANLKPDQTTFAGDEYRSADFYDKILDNEDQCEPLLSWRRMYLRTQELILVTVSPVLCNQTDGALSLVEHLSLHWHGSDDLAVVQTDGQTLPATSTSPMPTATALSSAAAQYLIVTSNSLLNAFEPLKQWKEMKGLSTEIVTIEEILASQQGVDGAAKLRNYLIGAHYDGVEYVLLGGDETVIPIRYAYNRNTDIAVSLDQQQICDLYYADLTGNWDSDGDGVYGEPYDDDPDLVPELKVGRVLANTTVEVQHYIDKLIAYEQNPGNGEYSYLQQSLFIAADQMRDYHEVGQHTLVADALPSYVQADITSLIESPSGDADNPAAPGVNNTLAELSHGFGMLTLLVHGAVDGWVIRSHDYNQWPKNYIFTGYSGAGDHGYLPTATPNHKPGVVYSIGCSNGGFDMDAAPWPGRNPCVAEAFLQQQNGGAVAFIGYSRWGWVSASWRLEQSFVEHIYGGDANIFDAMSASKLEYPNYRDLAYGMNLFGDPELQMWTQVPQSLSLELPDITLLGYNSVSCVVSDNSGPCSNVLVSVVQDGDIIEQATTNGSGVVTFGVDYNADAEYEVVAHLEGHRTASAELSPAITLDVDEDPALPDAFSLEQNFPNPFNPSTTISFTIQRPEQVRLEVFNILGQRVASLADEWLATGTHSVTWDGATDSGLPQPSGIYFARLQAGEQSDIIKMTLLK